MREVVVVGTNVKKKLVRRKECGLAGRVVGELGRMTAWGWGRWNWENQSITKRAENAVEVASIGTAKISESLSRNIQILGF